MRRIVASVAVIALLVGASASAAHAGGSTDAALGLASFAVFNQRVGPLFHPHRAVVVRREGIHQPVAVPPPTGGYAAPPPAYPPPYPTVVEYPNGRDSLRAHG